MINSDAKLEKRIIKYYKNPFGPYHWDATPWYQGYQRELEREREGGCRPEAIAIECYHGIMCIHDVERFKPSERNTPHSLCGRYLDASMGRSNILMNELASEIKNLETLNLGGGSRRKLLAAAWHSPDGWENNL